MNRFQRLKGILSVIGFVAMLSAGYLAFNYMISCKAEAQCHCSLCAPLGEISTAIATDIRDLIDDAMEHATDEIIAYFDSIHPPWAEQTPPKAEEVTAHQIAWWDTFFYYNLRPAMQAMTEQLSVADIDASSTVATFSDAVEMNRTMLVVAEEEVESHREMRPAENACVGGNVAKGMPDAAIMKDAYNAAAPPEMLPRSANAAGTPAAQGWIADQKVRWDEYEAKYCDPNINAGNMPCAVPGPLVGRDTDVAGEVFNKDTIYVNDADTKTVIDDLISNIGEPMVADPVPQDVLNTVEGEKAMLENLVLRARRQTALDVMYHVVSRRVPSSATSNLSAIIQPMRSQQSGAAGIPPALLTGPGGLPHQPSHNEVMQVMMSERYRTGRYSIDQVTEPENNERELIVQQAFQAMQLNDQLDLLDRWSMLLAAQISAHTTAKKEENRASDRGTR